MNKILNVNRNMVSAGRKDFAMNPAEESTLRLLKEALELNKPIPAGSLQLVTRIVTQWPYSDRLAGLDLLRCIAKYHVVAQLSDPQHGSLIDLAVSSSIPGGESPNENAAMMGVRTLANLFHSADGRSLAYAQADKGIAFLERVIGLSGGDAIGKYNRNMLVAVTTLAVNYSVLVNKEKLLVPAQRRRLLVIIGSVLKDQSDSEVLYRALVSLGTILSTSKEEAQNLGIASWIQAAASKNSEERVKGVVAECTKLAAQLK